MHVFFSPEFLYTVITDEQNDVSLKYKEDIKMVERKLRKVVVASAVRTAVGKHAGQWSPLTDVQLGAEAIKEAVKRAGIKPEEVEDVIMGNVHGTRSNIGRNASLLAGLPIETTAYSLDRQCGSGSQAIANAAAEIMIGNADIMIGCGVESMTRNPWVIEKPDKAFPYANLQFASKHLAPAHMFEPILMPQTADKLAAMKGVTREDCDKFALLSHQRAAKAIKEGVFKEQIVPVEIKTKKGTVVVDTDECVRYDANLETMSKLKALYPGGVTTAGNSCPRSDGAGALVLMSEEAAEKHGVEPLGYITAFCAGGCDPTIMGYGPVPAVTKLLKKTGLTVDDIDLVELNEAFAGQAVPCIRDLGLDIEKVNPNGGAIALGHPLGGTGAVLATKLLYEMKRKNYKRGIVTMCIGGGQGYAVLYERP